MQNKRNNADRWGGLTDIDHHDVDDPPPDRIITESDDQREDHGKGDNHCGNGLEDAAHYEIHHEQQENDGQRRYVHRLDFPDQQFGHLGQRDKVGEDIGTENDDIDESRIGCCFGQHLAQHLKRKSATKKGKKSSKETTDRCRLEYRDDTAVNTAAHDDA